MEPVRQELLLSAAGAWGACCSNLVSCRVMLRAERARAWNLFAGKLIPCFSGNKARQEYDKVDKTEAEEIQFSSGFIGIDDLNTFPLADIHRTSQGIDESGLIEFYVVGKDFSWCYVVTHELDMCGPYFCYAPTTKMVT